jgi:hypothetical protein
MQRFFTGGHRTAGDNVRLSNGFWGARKMKLPSNFTASYGDILSLCGDFYGNAEQVISSVSNQSERETRFEQYTYGCLARDTKDPNRIFPIATNEFLLKQLKVPENCSGYGDLADTDYDHFAAIEGYDFGEQTGGGAWEAYSAGHSVACKTAAAGNQSEEVLEFALTMNACASHFLSEMFSSGHMRTPRRFLGRATAWWMENEDDQWGLNVHNKRGDDWRAYGNTCHAEPANKKNAEIELEALQASAEAILQAWKDGNATTCQADDQVDQIKPNFAAVQDSLSAALIKNSAPLFVAHNGSNATLGMGNLSGASTRLATCDMDKYHHTYCWDWRTVYEMLDTECPVNLRGAKPFYHQNCHDSGM